MSLALKALAVACPVVKDPEAVRCVHFSQLHLDAVVGITIGSEDVQAPTQRCGQLLGYNPDFTKAQPGRVLGPM
jgi:hypothetical protein